MDLAFLTPDGRNIDVRTLKPLDGPSREGAWVRDIVATAKNEAGDGKEIVEKTIELMRKLARLYPLKSDEQSTPWQVSLSHAIFVSAWDGRLARSGGARDQRRILIVPSSGGDVDPSLETALEASDVLKRFERHYVFVRIDPKEAPVELKEALEGAGSKGVLLLDAARSVNGFGQNQDRLPRIYPKVLASPAGPLTKAALVELLGKHVASNEGSRDSGSR